MQDEEDRDPHHHRHDHDGGSDGLRQYPDERLGVQQLRRLRVHHHAGDGSRRQDLVRMESRDRVSPGAAPKHVEVLRTWKNRKTQRGAGDDRCQPQTLARFAGTHEETIISCTIPRREQPTVVPPTPPQVHTRLAGGFF